MCLACPGGKIFYTSASYRSYCVPDSHDWNFRSCSHDEVAVVDSIYGSDLRATAKKGATCSADGIVLDGNDDYIDIDDWEWGGTTAIEVYVKYDTFNSHSRVFDFGNGESSDNFLLSNDGTSSTIASGVLQGSRDKYLTTSNFDSATWTHVVVTVKDRSMTMYKNGVLVGT